MKRRRRGKGRPKRWKIRGWSKWKGVNHCGEEPGGKASRCVSGWNESLVEGVTGKVGSSG